MKVRATDQDLVVSGLAEFHPFDALVSKIMSKDIFSNGEKSYFSKENDGGFSWVILL
jgi:hypothetical protein